MPSEIRCFIGIDIQDLRFDLLADRQNIGGLVDARPGNIADVQQRVHAADIDESAVISQAAHRALHNVCLPGLSE